MRLPLVRYEGEGLTELSVELSCTVTHDRQAAALEWTILGEGGDYHVPAGLYRAKRGLNARVSIFRSRQKVKDSAVMPYVK